MEERTYVQIDTVNDRKSFAALITINMNFLQGEGGGAVAWWAEAQ